MNDVALWIIKDGPSNLTKNNPLTIFPKANDSNNLKLWNLSFTLKGNEIKLHFKRPNVEP